MPSNPTVYIVQVQANALQFDDLIWAVFNTEEDACWYVESNVARGLKDRAGQEEDIFLLKGSCNTWLGYTTDKNLLVYVGIRVAVVGEEVHS
jgi:hypothetical protein